MSEVQKSGSSVALIGGLIVAVLGVGSFIAYKVLGKKPAKTGGATSKSTIADAGTDEGGSEESESSASPAPSGGGAPAPAPTDATAKLKGKDKRQAVKQAGVGLKGKAKRQAKRAVRKANKGFNGIDEDSSFDAPGQIQAQ